jgi:hypothetical protein
MQYNDNKLDKIWSNQTYTVSCPFDEALEFSIAVWRLQHWNTDMSNDVNNHTTQQCDHLAVASTGHRLGV